MTTETAATVEVIPGKPVVEYFERETCGRCGGSGTYSYCEMYGTTCFKCFYAKGAPGRGWNLTKRGTAALAFYLDLAPRKRADEVQPGDVIMDDGKRRTVISVGQSESCSIAADGTRRYYFDIQTKRVTMGKFPESQVRMARSFEQARADLAAALAYQSTLTVKGKPSKRSRKGGK